MADTAVTIRLGKKSRLERQFDRDEARATRNAEISRRREKTRKEREEKAQSRREIKDLRELLSVFRRDQPLKISHQIGYAHPYAYFTFRGQEYRLGYANWSIGEEGVDSWKTEHEGWKLYVGLNGSEGRTLFEVEKYSTPPRLKPTPEEFKKSIVRALRELDSERQARYQRRLYDHNDI